MARWLGRPAGKELVVMVGAAAAVAHGQGWRQVGELLLAFALSSVVGLERQYRGKSAGLRTQTIVGTASALILIISKYGFSDVLMARTVVLDPSRVAAQIVSGIGFLGAGLIITRRGAIRGLTTAAAHRIAAGIDSCNRTTKVSQGFWSLDCKSRTLRPPLRRTSSDVRAAGVACPKRSSGAWWSCGPEEMERTRSSGASATRRRRGVRGFAQDRCLDRSRAPAGDRGAGLEGTVGSRNHADQLRWRGAHRILPVRTPPGPVRRGDQRTGRPSSR